MKYRIISIKIPVVFILFLSFNSFSVDLKNLNSEDLSKTAKSILALLEEKLIIAKQPGSFTVKNHFVEDEFKATIIVTEDPDLVIKVFNVDDGYKDEAEDIPSVTKISDEVIKANQENQYNIPVLIKYIANLETQDRNGIIVMEKANGDSLLNFVKNIDKMNDKDIETMFDAIGEQYGNLRRLFYPKDKYLRFDDSSFGNVYFDEGTKKTIWIDLLGVHGIHFMKTTNRTKNKISLEKPMFFVEQLIKLTQPEPTRANYGVENISSSTFNELDCEKSGPLVTTLEKRLVALWAVYKGFYRAVAKLDSEDASKFLATEFNAVKENIESVVSEINTVLENKQCTLAKLPSTEVGIPMPNL